MVRISAELLPAVVCVTPPLLHLSALEVGSLYGLFVRDPHRDPLSFGLLLGTNLGFPMQCVEGQLARRVHARSSPPFVSFTVPMPFTGVTHTVQSPPLDVKYLRT